VAIYEEDLDLADAWLAKSLAAFEGLEDATGVGFVYATQGMVASARDDYQRAEDLLWSSLQIFRETSDQLGRSTSLRILAGVARRRGELEDATTLFREALQSADGVGCRADRAWCLEGLAGIACAQGMPERAARLFGATLALRQTAGIRLASALPSELEQDRIDTRTKLGDKAFEAEVAVGRQMTLRQAMEFALSDSPQPSSGREQRPTDQARRRTPLQLEKQKYDGLTAREREVAVLIAKGRSNRAIADELVITVRTVESHVTNILRKLGFASRAQVAGWAIDRGLAAAPKTLEERIPGPFDSQ
jgi:non-specific serine/threonine protein kinase